MHSQNDMYAEQEATAVLTDVESACLRSHARRGGPWEFVMGLMACDISFFMLLRSFFSRMTQDLMAPPAFFISLANEFFLTEEDGQPRLKDGISLGLLALEFLSHHVSKIVITLSLKTTRDSKFILLSLAVLRLGVLLIAQRLSIR